MISRRRWPNRSDRLRRALRSQSNWMMPSNKLSELDAQMRNVNAWMDGYDAAMRDIRGKP